MFTSNLSIEHTLVQLTSKQWELFNNESICFIQQSSRSLRMSVDRAYWRKKQSENVSSNGARKEFETCCEME